MTKAAKRPLMTRTADGHYLNVNGVAARQQYRGNVNPFSAQEFDNMVHQRGEFAGPFYAHSGREDRLMATVMELQHQLRVTRGKLGAARRTPAGPSTSPTKVY